jgi:hypothetical protein
VTTAVICPRRLEARLSQICRQHDPDQGRPVNEDRGPGLLCNVPRHQLRITGPDRQCNCTDKTKEMELLRVWQAENMKKVWKRRGGTYGVAEGQVINTRLSARNIPVRQTLL